MLGLGLEVGLDKKSSSTAAAVDNSGQTFKEFWIAKGKALGITPGPQEGNDAYIERVRKHVKGTVG